MENICHNLTLDHSYQLLWQHYGSANFRFRAAVPFEPKSTFQPQRKFQRLLF